VSEANAPSIYAILIYINWPRKFKSTMICILFFKYISYFPTIISDKIYSIVNKPLIRTNNIHSKNLSCNSQIFISILERGHKIKSTPNNPVWIHLYIYHSYKICNRIRGIYKIYWAQGKCGHAGVAWGPFCEKKT
jgi:hypothetical protein